MSTNNRKPEVKEVKIEAIKMKDGGDSSIPGLGNFKKGKIRLVPKHVSIKDAKKLVERGVADSVERSEYDKQVAASKEKAPKVPVKEEVKDNGGE